jgi:predicted deacylase
MRLLLETMAQRALCASQSRRIAEYSGRPGRTEFIPFANAHSHAFDRRFIRRSARGSRRAPGHSRREKIAAHVRKLGQGADVLLDVRTADNSVFAGSSASDSQRAIA